MNAVNRALVVVLLFVVMALCSITLVAPGPVLNVVAQRAAATAAFLNTIRSYVRVPLGILFALTLVVVCGLLVVFELRRPTRKFVRVEKATGGDVLVSIASIADRLRYEVDALVNVLRVKPKVSARRKGVVVALDVETAAGIDVTVEAGQIVETARQVVEERMGLKLARPPRVNLRAVPYPRVVKALVPTKVPEVPVEPEEPSFAELSPAPSLTPIELEDLSLSSEED